MVIINLSHFNENSSMTLSIYKEDVTPLPITIRHKLSSYNIGGYNIGGELLDHSVSKSDQIGYVFDLQVSSDGYDD